MFLDHLCRSIEFEKTEAVEYVGPIQATFYGLGECLGIISGSELRGKITYLYFRRGFLASK